MSEPTSAKDAGSPPSSIDEAAINAVKAASSAARSLPEFYWGGWVLGVLIIGVGIILPFVVFAWRNKNSIPLFDLMKKR